MFEEGVIAGYLPKGTIKQLGIVVIREGSMIAVYLHNSRDIKGRYRTKAETLIGY